MLLVNDCLSLETLLLSLLRKLTRSNSLYEGRGETGALHGGAGGTRMTRGGGYQCIGETPPQV
ncbi:hypothetical protein EON64_13875 [archaeon]|nr:MAG: hypothetical protein EON64_13875 [archaeon]